MIKNCETCKKEFFTYPSEIKKGNGKYCSSVCYHKSHTNKALSPETRKKITESRLGEKNWAKRPEVREKIRQSLLGRDRGGNKKTCKTCKKQFKDCPSNKTVNCSKKCSAKYFSQFSGEKSHSWQGGLTPIHLKERRGLKYKQWRIAVFARDNATCQKCGQRGGKLQVDHDLPFAIYPDLRFEVLNGQTLCVPCHQIKTKQDLKIIKEHKEQWFSMM